MRCFLVFGVGPLNGKKGIGMRAFLLGFLVAGFALTQSPAMAEEGELETFFGDWKGVGITEQVSEAGEFSYTSRDLDVTIRPEKDGFSITWTAEERDKDGYLIRRTGNLAFVSLGNGVFETLDPPQKGPKKGLMHQRTWARLSGQSLIIYVFEIGEGGVYEISRYVRTLSSLDQMELGYTRDFDGRPVRGVVGQLTRMRQ